MARFNIVVGISTRGPEHAAREAEKKARKAGGEQVSIAACAVAGAPGFRPSELDMLNNIAKNIYQLVLCTCPEIIGQKITMPGTPPPLFRLTSAPAGATTWVVYILLRK
jgi:hypothetical protein